MKEQNKTLLSKEEDMSISDITSDSGNLSATAQAVDGEAITMSCGMNSTSATTTTTEPEEGEAVTPAPPYDGSSTTTTTTEPEEGEAVTPPTPPGDSSSTTTTTGTTEGEAVTPTPPGDSSSTTTTETPDDDDTPEGGYDVPSGGENGSSTTTLQLNIYEILDKYERVGDDDAKKRQTLLEVGREMASWNMYHPTFIIGMLGHLKSEGNIGYFEGVGASWKGYMQKTIEVYENYPTDYSQKYIYEDGRNVTTVEAMVQHLSTIPIENDLTAGFGLGCCQWTFERTQKLINYYKDKSTTTITYEQTRDAELAYLKKELTGDYERIYPYWYNSWTNRSHDAAAVEYWESTEDGITFNGDLESADAAYWAARCIVVGFGYNPEHLGKPSYGDPKTVKTKAEDARKLFEELVY